MCQTGKQVPQKETLVPRKEELVPHKDVFVPHWMALLPHIMTFMPQGGSSVSLKCIIAWCWCTCASQRDAEDLLREKIGHFVFAFIKLCLADYFVPRRLMARWQHFPTPCHRLAYNRSPWMPSFPLYSYPASRSPWWGCTKLFQTFKSYTSFLAFGWIFADMVLMLLFSN